ncbi:MAG TPA: glycosyl hydrolase 108 family protein [Gammaproteobacteria bacterium]|jgi:lysozyme family protein|nr:glycosyl hydrolase 108 family protein [Gammaproteobacteria bacterium]
MANFLKAVNYVLDNEGLDKFVDHPNDRGGATRWGISLRFLKSLSKDKLKQYGFSCDEPDVDDVRTMSRDQAIEIYRGEFWQHANFDRIIDQDVGNYLFDMAVNSGISPAIKCAQRAIWSVYRSRKKCVEDGILGAETLRILNQYSADEVLPIIRSERAGDYRSIVAADQTQKIFMNGWLNRAYEK